MNKSILSIMLLAINLVGPNAYALSPLQNSGFESWTGNSPDGWMVSKNSTGNFRDYDVTSSSWGYYEGQKCARINLSTPQIPFYEGGIYEATTYIYIKN